MLSNPPATTILFNPRPMVIAPKATDLIPEEQTLFTVVQGTLIPTPKSKESKVVRQIRKTSSQRSLTSGVLTLTRLANSPHDHFVHVRAEQIYRVEGRLNGKGSEFRSLEFGKLAQEGGNGGSFGCDDVGRLAEGDVGGEALG